MKTTTAAFALLLACSALQGCDRRQTDGHSTTPPDQGAATQAPAEAPADQSVQPAAPPPAQAESQPQDADAADQASDPPAQ